MTALDVTALDELFRRPQFSVPQPEKEALLRDGLAALTAHHAEHSPAYRRLLEAFHPGASDAGDAWVRRVSDVPYLPVGLFKTHRLASIPDDEVFKTLTSSGTTGQQVSRIYLDRETARLQSAALSAIMQHVLGPRRLPMLIVDTVALLRDRTQFSARGAGVLGMMNFGRNHTYALDEHMALDEDALAAFLAAHGGAPFLVFGFTFMVWRYLYQRLRGRGVDLSNGVLVHSGGWKKLQDESVGNDEFKAALRAETGLARVYNFYGMVEQVGSVFLEGEDGYLYAPNFADVVVRDPRTWEEAEVGEPGVIQVVSLLPRSYPGHSLLTEDLGVVHGVDDSTVGRFGKRFSVLGRVPKAELRGCSDVHAASTAGVTAGAA